MNGRSSLRLHSFLLPCTNIHTRLLELQEDDSKAGREATIQLPPKDVAMTFAVETINYPYPVGLHQPRRYGKNEDVSLDEYCPEYKLCIKYGDK